jgi:hypothetical protein
MRTISDSAVGLQGPPYSPNGGQRNCNDLQQRILLMMERSMHWSQLVDNAKRSHLQLLCKPSSCVAMMDVQTASPVDFLSKGHGFICNACHEEHLSVKLECLMQGSIVHCQTDCYLPSQQAGHLQAPGTFYHDECTLESTEFYQGCSSTSFPPASSVFGTLAFDIPLQKQVSDSKLNAWKPQHTMTDIRYSFFQSLIEHRF